MILSDYAADKPIVYRYYYTNDCLSDYAVDKPTICLYYYTRSITLRLSVPEKKSDYPKLIQTVEKKRRKTVHFCLKGNKQIVLSNKTKHCIMHRKGTICFIASACGVPKISARLGSGVCRNV